LKKRLSKKQLREARMGAPSIGPRGGCGRERAHDEREGMERTGCDLRTLNEHRLDARENRLAAKFRQQPALADPRLAADENKGANPFTIVGPRGRCQHLQKALSLTRPPHHAMGGQIGALRLCGLEPWSPTRREVEVANQILRVLKS